MPVLKKAILGCVLLVAFSVLSAQSTPTVFLGPYEQAHAAQFEGDWMRSDGTYRLEISEEEAEIEAKYLNPSPIHVESAALLEGEDDELTLKIVLRDEGYPGSVYRLEYIPQYRVLAGTYTIPGQPPAEVFFTQ
jgi:hypothetical protein